jgi:hypothetical protein
MPQVTLDTAVLRRLLQQAASAARLVGHMDDDVPATAAIGPFADTLDEIVHTLTELLGDPHVITARVPNASSTFAPDVVMRAGTPTISKPDAPSASRARSLIIRAASAQPDVPCSAIEAKQARADHRRAGVHGERIAGCMPPAPSNQLKIESAVLVDVLRHATSAARIVGHSDAIAAGPLADHIDAIVHELSELLGNPHLRASPDAVASDGQVAYDGAPMLTSGAGGAP